MKEAVRRETAAAEAKAARAQREAERRREAAARPGPLGGLGALFGSFDLDALRAKFASA